VVQIGEHGEIRRVDRVGREAIAAVDGQGQPGLGQIRQRNRRRGGICGAC